MIPAQFVVAAWGRGRMALLRHKACTDIGSTACRHRAGARDGGPWRQRLPVRPVKVIAS